MKPVYKMVRVSAAHCPECNQELWGNNSIALPWNCKCGVWKFVWKESGEYDYDIEAIQEKIKKEKRNIEPPEESEIDYGPYGEGGFVNYK